MFVWLKQLLVSLQVTALFPQRRLEAAGANDDQEWTSRESKLERQIELLLQKNAALEKLVALKVRCALLAMAQVKVRFI